MKGFIRRKVIVCLRVLTHAVLSVGAFSTSAQTPDVCDRTPQVRDEIVRLSGAGDCAGVTEEDLGDIQIMNLKDRGIGDLRENDFAGLINLQRLDLGDNSLSELSPGVFREIGKLQRLLLAGNNLSTLSAGAFEGLENLQRLNLIKNNLTELLPGVFQGLGNLQILHLSRNRLGELPPGVFQGLNSLHQLNLDFNDLRELPVDVFKNLARLDRLRLDVNNLHELPADVFAGLGSLEKLYLSYNYLEELPAGVFAGLSNLKELGLDSNHLSVLPAGVFAGLSRLEKLRLEDNRGSPFRLGLRLEPTARPVTGGVPAEVRLTLREGAPFNMTIHFSVQGGAVSPGRVRLSKGSTQSEIIAVSQNGESPVVITPSEPVKPIECSAPTCYRGFELVAESFVSAGLPTVWFESARIEVEEIGAAKVAVNAMSVQKPAITLSYSLGTDNDENTADADGQDYNVPGAGSASIEAGKTSTIIEINAVNNAADEPVRESFVMSLDPPGAEAGYVLGSPSTVEIVIVAGVCGKTEAVREEIVRIIPGVQDCADVTAEHLAGIRALNVSGKGISSLKANDFAGLSDLRTLRLQNNRLRQLPPRVFAGLSRLETLDLGSNSLRLLPPTVLTGLGRLYGLYLAGNDLRELPTDVFAGLNGLRRVELHSNDLYDLPPGGFALHSNNWNQFYLHANPRRLFIGVLRLNPVGGEDTTGFSVRSRLTLREGSPFILDVALSAQGGTVSPNRVRFSPGDTQSEVITISRTGWGSVTVTPSIVTRSRACYSCFDLYSIRSRPFILGPRLSVVSLESTRITVEENQAAEISVTSSLPQRSTITVEYRVGRDNDEHTADADKGDYSAELVTIAPGSTATVIRIPITDDDIAEPTSETFTVSLTAPSDDAGYVLGSSVTATVVIREGICDRTPAVQRVIRDSLIAAGAFGNGYRCADVTSADLADIQGDLYLINRGIENLKQGDFRGLKNVGRLFLSLNNMSTLTAGVFEGLDGLRELYLSNAGLSSLSPAAFRGLHNLQILDLSLNPGLRALSPRAFSSLGALRSLHLHLTGLEALPAAAFSGLGSLESVFLHGNPRLSFQLTPEFERVRSLDRGSAEFRLIMHEGAPFEMTVTLSAKDGTVSLSEVTLPRGGTASDTFELSQSGSLPAVVTMSGEFAPPCAVCYLGLTVAAGSPYILDEIGPAASGVEFLSAPRQGDSYLVSRDKRPSLRLAVSFDEAVIVSVSTGSPVLALGVGETTRMASYDPDTSSTNRLVFHYQLTMDDFDNDGVGIAEDALRPNGATLQDAKGNEAKLDLTSHAIPNATAHKVYRQSELSLATTQVEIVEEGTVLLAVSATPPPHVDLDVGYRLSDQGGNKDYSGPSVGLVSLPAFASTGTIRISIEDDGVIEPPREFFTVSLTTPAPSTAYFVVSPATATVVVKEGICDRTPPVQAKILDKIASGPGLSETPLGERCPGVRETDLADLTGRLEINGQPGASILKEKDFEGLTGITSLSLNGNRISELPAKVFRGLVSLEELTLWNNGLTELPAGLFAGLTNLTKVWLQDNPKAPFALTLRFERVEPAGEPAPDVFPLRLVVVEGAPFEITGDLSLRNAVSPSTRVVVPTGSTVSKVFTVTRMDADLPVIVDLENLSQAPKTQCRDGSCYQGIRVGALKPFDPSRRVVDLSVPPLVPVGPDGSTMFTVTTVPVLTGREQVTVRFTIHSAFRFGFILPDGSTDKTTEFSLSGAISAVSVSAEAPPDSSKEAVVVIEILSTQNVVVNHPETFKLHPILQLSSDNNAAGQGGSAPPTTMPQYAAPPDSPPPISASLVFSPSTQVQVEQGRSTTFGVSVSPALVLGETLSLRLAILEDENQAVGGVTFAGSSSVRLTFDGGSSAGERQVPVSASATAVIGSTAPVFADEVAALGMSFAGKSLTGKSPLLELLVTTPRVVVSFTPEALSPLEVGSSSTVSLSLRDYELNPGQQAKLRVQMFGAGWSVYPETVTLTTETPAAEVSLSASDEATFGVLRVTALAGVELLREAVLEVRVGR